VLEFRIIQFIQNLLSCLNEVGLIFPINKYFHSLNNSTGNFINK